MANFAMQVPKRAGYAPVPLSAGPPTTHLRPDAENWYTQAPAMAFFCTFTGLPRRKKRCANEFGTVVSAARSLGLHSRVGALTSLPRCGSTDDPPPPAPRSPLPRAPASGAKR